MESIIERHKEFLENAIAVEENCIETAERNGWTKKAGYHRCKKKSYQDVLANLRFLFNGQKKVV